MVDATRGFTPGALSQRNASDCPRRQRRDFAGIFHVLKEATVGPNTLQSSGE